MIKRELLDPEIVNQDEQDLFIEDLVLRMGFTVVPNFIFKMKLSAHAKLLYIVLLKFAWENNFCFPGYDVIMEAMSISSRATLSKYLKELEEAGLIKKIRRGLGQTNAYILRSVSKLLQELKERGELIRKKPEDKSEKKEPKYLYDL